MCGGRWTRAEQAALGDVDSSCSRTTRVPAGSRVREVSHVKLDVKTRLSSVSILDLHAMKSDHVQKLFTGI